MGVVLSEPPAEAGSACSEFLSDPPQAPKARATSMWCVLLALIVFPVLAIIELMPMTRAGWVVLALFLLPLVGVGAAALAAIFI